MLRNASLFIVMWLLPLTLCGGVVLGSIAMSHHYGWSLMLSPLAIVDLLVQFIILGAGTLLLRRWWPDTPGRAVAIASHSVLTMGTFPIVTMLTFQAFS